MGLLRLFLAISVAIQHSGKAWGIGGGRAVEIFFIISGFYMGLILNSGKYQHYKTYLINRFLRIFPLYWVNLLLIPQAWSLGLELTFYFLAPFLLWRKPKNALYLLLTFISLSIFCKVILLISGHPYDPWCYRFFPSILYLFLLGTITYQYYS